MALKMHLLGIILKISYYPIKVTPVKILHSILGPSAAAPYLDCYAQWKNQY